MTAFIKRHWIIVCILILASLLRFYHLGSVPPSPSLDEVSIGYNAYSILKTGADEYGTKFPILLRAYDDWRPALYVYFVIPFVGLLGLTPVAVRLPSVIASVLSVWVTYVLVKNFFDSRGEWPKKWILPIAHISSLLLAVSPWHIYISRLGHEANIGLAFIVIGLCFFFQALRNQDKKYFYVVSAVFFALSLYAYQSQKVITPFLLLVLGMLFGKQLIKEKRYIFLSCITAVVLLVPLISISTKPETLLRARATSAFTHSDPLYLANEQRYLDAWRSNDLIGRMKYHRIPTMIRIYMNNYLSNYRMRWLFTGGENEQFKAPGVGLLYVWELPFIFVGLVSLFFIPLSKQIKLFVILWLLSGPLASGFTAGNPHAMRSFTMLPVWQILGSVGIVSVLSALRLKKVRALGVISFLIVALGSTVFFIRQYFIEFPLKHSDSFQYALSQAIPYAIAHESDYERIIISNEKQLYQSYMFYLFLSKFDPKEYQQRGGTKSGGYAETHVIGKYEFRPIDWKNEKKEKGTIYFGNPADFPRDIGTTADFNNLNQENGILAVSI